MCCFSGPVTYVKSTNIFAREGEGNLQYLAYSLALGSEKDVAMILPLPIPVNSPEDAVQFIDLHEYPSMFDDLEKLHPPRPRSRGNSVDSLGLDSKQDKVLEVKQVGSFEASFVPKIADFARLDERFRLPENTWDQLPAYKDYGFAVFKFKAGESTIHPMAFTFPRADEKRIFFPTVHIHDGKVHKEAEFDHALYVQIGKRSDSTLAESKRWSELPIMPNGVVQIEKTKEIISPNQHVFFQRIVGNHANQDTYIDFT